LILIDYFSREFMQGVLSTPRRPAVQPFRLPLVALALRLGDLLLDTAIKLSRLELIPVAGGDGVLQPQIQPNGFIGCA
jgi:hypothetical protein